MDALELMLKGCERGAKDAKGCERMRKDAKEAQRVRKRHKKVVTAFSISSWFLCVLNVTPSWWRVG